MRKSRLSQYKQNKLSALFIAGVTAGTAAELSGVHKNTAAYYFHRLRVLIAEHAEQHAQLNGETETDERYSGGTRRGKRGRGAAGKVPVFGILQRGARVYTKVVADVKTGTLMPIIKEKICPDSIVYTDTFASCDVPEVSHFKHYRISHSVQFVDKNCRKNHINGIENFRNKAKRHMRKFIGIPKAHFWLFLKDCEWRFNTPGAKQQLILLKQIVMGKIQSLSRTVPNIFFSSLISQPGMNKAMPVNK